MVEIFPEIESFFQQEQFSQEELDVLREDIEKKYKDEHSRKLAISAINIKLLQYQLSGPLAPRGEENANKTEGKKAKQKKTKSIDEKPFVNDMFNVFIKVVLNQPVKIVAINLGLQPEKLVKKLKSPDGKKITEESDFTEQIINKNSDFIKRRLHAHRKKSLKQHKKLSSVPLKPKKSKTQKFKFKSNASSKTKNKKTSWVKKSKHKSSSASGVYGKLASAKSIGKIIYTRMR